MSKAVRLEESPERGFLDTPSSGQDENSRKSDYLGVKEAMAQAGSSILTFMNRKSDQGDAPALLSNAGYEEDAEDNGGTKNEPKVSIPHANVLRKRASLSEMEETMLLESQRREALQSLEHVLKRQEHTSFNSQTFSSLCSRQDLLCILFRLFDHQAVGKIQQETLVALLKTKLRSAAGTDFAELIETVAYLVAENDDLTTGTFVKVFQCKGVLPKLWNLINKEAPEVTTLTILDFFTRITNPKRDFELTPEDIAKLEQLFLARKGTGDELQLQDFKKLFQSKNDFFAERVFKIFDTDNSGGVSLKEFLEGANQYCGKSLDDKVRFLFKIYDLNDNGLIKKPELKSVLRACMVENGMSFTEQQIEDLTVALYEDADTEERGAITYEALKAQLKKHPGLLENLSISVDRWLAPPKDEAPVRRKTPPILTLTYWKNNWVLALFVILFWAINAVLFIYRALQFKDHPIGVFYVFARASGYCLNFNCMFVLVLMLRHSMTYLRSSIIGRYLPLDEHVYLHIMCGFTILFHALLHTLMHIINFAFRTETVNEVLRDAGLVHEDYSAYEWLFTAEPGILGLIPGWANPTGWPLVAILLVIVICALPVVRRSGLFEVFYWTHILYVPFWALLILHGPNYWKWFVGPAAIFVIERCIRFTRLITKHGHTFVSSGVVLPSKVTHLIIRKPDNFHYHPGDYVFVNIPTIAKYEWHAFTISSAPEQEGVLWLHVRAVGGWTHRLYDYFEKAYAKLQSAVQAQSKDQECQKCAFLAREPELNTLARLRESFRGSKTRDISRLVHTCHLSHKAMDREHKSLDVTDFNPLVKNSRRIRASLKSTELHLRKLEQDPTWNELNRIKSSPERDLALQALADEDPEEYERIMKLKLEVAENNSLERMYGHGRLTPSVVKLRVPSVGKTRVSKSHSTPRESLNLQSDHKKRLPSLCTANARSQSCDVTDAAGVRYSALERAEKGQAGLEVVEAEAKPVQIYIDGPYGTPSSHIFYAKHAVLVGAGIGVTPFASILQSIMHRYWNTKQTCPQCACCFSSRMPTSIMQLRKVDFFWINRDHKSFEWFANLLSQLELEQAEKGGAMERFLEMHMYVTSALQKTDMKAVGLQMAMDLLYQKGARCLITGLKTRTNAGRPNWNKVFQQIADQNKGEVTVFYCGPPQLAQTLKTKCAEFGFRFRVEVF